MNPPTKPGLYRVKLGSRWTVGEYFVPEERDEEPYWAVIGSEEGFASNEFAAIGSQVLGFRCRAKRVKGV